MIKGKVNADEEAVVRIHLQGLGEKSVEVEAVIDTGYNGYLTLPAHQISFLALPLQGSRWVTLADGSSIPLDLFRVSLIWNGSLTAVQVLEAEGSPLIGMSLLRGSRLVVDVVDGGDVTIQPLADC